MENAIQIFTNAEFGSFRALKIDGKDYFVGKDIADILGYANSRDALTLHVDEEDKRIIQKSEITTLEIPNRGLTVINESGLYSLIHSSKLPTAKKFKHWVTSEVLPAIRKHGAYFSEPTAEEILNNPYKLMTIFQNFIAEREKRIAAENLIEEQKPKVVFADAVETSDNSILIGELAKLLKQNGVDIGQNRLFEWLRDNGYLIQGNRADKNAPTQAAMEMKLFEVKERTIHNPDGSIRTTRTTKVTGKGQVYFINKFLKNFAA